MTTLLEAAQVFIARLGLSGAGPTTVLSQVPEYNKPIQALIKAHKEIVSSHIDWSFLWREGDVSVGVGSNPASPTQTDIREYDKHTFYHDGNALDVVPWTTYRNRKLSAAEQAATDQPSLVVIKPDKEILVLPYPNDTYAITFDYWARAAELTADDSVLQIPDDGIETLYDRAKMLWLGDEEAPNYVLAQTDFEINYDALEDTYWPGKAQSTLAGGQDIVVVPE